MGISEGNIQFATLKKHYLQNVFKKEGNETGRIMIKGNM